MRFLSGMVEQALVSVPKKLIIFDRQGKPAMELGGENTGGRNTYYGTGSDLRYTTDTVSGEIRMTRAQDIGDMARVVDAMDNFEFTMPYGHPRGCPRGRSLLYRVYPNGNQHGQTDRFYFGQQSRQRQNYRYGLCCSRGDGAAAGKTVYP